MASTQFTVPGAFDAVAGVFAERQAVLRGDSAVTFAGLATRSRALAAHLRGRGLGAVRTRDGLAGHESGQDHLGIYLYNGNEYLEALLGAFRARVAPFNVNYRYVEDELVQLLDDADCRGLVYHATFAPTLAAVRDRLPRLRVLVQVADESGHPLLPGAVDYEAAVDGTVPELDVEPSPDDLYVLYTGGTTGAPKGVLWRQHDVFMSAMGGRDVLTGEAFTSYEALVANARSFEPGLRFLILPPLMHGAAQWAAFIALSGGHTVVFPPDTRRLDPAEVWRTVERVGATTMTVVGDAVARPLVDELETGTYDVSSLVSFGSGGAPLTPTIKQRLLARMPGILVTDSMGSSETGVQGSHVSTAGAVATGRFTPGPGTVVVGEDLDEVVAPGHAGLGWLAQQGWMPLGYYGDAAKTARTFPVIDGVRYSVPGDRARHLADGQIELLGRDAMTINSGGEKIFAEEVEQAVAGHPAVHDVVVVGRPSPRWGSEVVALVAPAGGATVTAEEIVAHAGRHLARYKLPKTVLFLDTIVRSPSGKADYRWARQQVTPE